MEHFQFQRKLIMVYFSSLIPVCITDCEQEDGTEIKFHDSKDIMNYEHSIGSQIKELKFHVINTV